MTTKYNDPRSKRNSRSLGKGSRTNYDLRKRAQLSLTVTHEYAHDSTPEMVIYPVDSIIHLLDNCGQIISLKINSLRILPELVSPSEEKTIKDFEVPASGSQSSYWKSSLEFAPQSQEELKKIYRERPWRCREKSESWDSEESEEEEFTEEQWKQTEAHKLLLNDFVTIAKQLSTS